ncbi:ZBTB46 [Branchiostoma lanceolatum]|uniref:ZBTB46 protein n=1 Tax=Branchiostoma lanceolatum TaxID=7740 RepID=A0A8J9ZD05_BRALA|nr:ZBTB46 [Branchiostoma lanceolatum]
MAALMPHTCEYPALPTYILTCLQDQRQTGRMCDVNIKVGSSSFPAHRCVLCACSGYFKALFTDSDASSVELRLVTERGVSVLLDYMYTARLQLTAGVAQEVMLAAVYLQVTDIMEDCTAYLGRTFQQSQLAGQRSTVSMATVSQHGRQDSSDRGNNVSEEGESQRRIHVDQSGEPSRRRVSRDTSEDAVNHMVEGGSRLDRVHEGRSNSSNHKAVSKANVGNRLKGVHDGRASLTNHTSALSSEVGSRQEGVHDGRASSTNHMSALRSEMGNRLEEMHDGRASSSNHMPALQSESEDNPQVQGHSNVLNTAPEQSDVDVTEAPTLWTTTEGGSLLQAGLQDNQNNRKEEDDVNTCDRTAPPALSPGTAARQSTGNETISQVNMFATMLPRSCSMSLTSEGQGRTPESSMMRGGGDLGDSIPRSHQQTTLRSGQAVVTGPSTLQHQGSVGNTTVSYSNAGSFASIPGASTTQNMATFSVMAAGANPSQHHPVTMETSAGTSPKVFCCTECNAVFKYDSSLRAHKLYKHSNARPFVCQDCGYAFKAKGMLLRHRRSQHPKPDGL